MKMSTKEFDDARDDAFARGFEQGLAHAEEKRAPVEKTDVTSLSYSAGLEDGRRGAIAETCERLHARFENEFADGSAFWSNTMFRVDRVMTEFLSEEVPEALVPEDGT